MLFIILILSLVLLDQVTKYLVLIFINEHQSVTIIKNFFHITSVRNTGAAWGKFENQMGLFYIISFLAIVFFTYYLITTGDFSINYFYTISLILIISGTFGNSIDRLYRKKVIDFLDFHIFGYDFPVFNFADIFLTIGTIGIAKFVLL